MRFPFMYAVRFDGDVPFWWDFSGNNNTRHGKKLHSGNLTSKERAEEFLNTPGTDKRYRLVKLKLTKAD